MGRKRKYTEKHKRLYTIWSTIKQRCFNPKDDKYHLYGGRGINMCDEWVNDFMAFYNWSLSNGYAPLLTIDRINSNKGYKPSNCRWATTKQQNRNSRRNRVILFNGQKKCIGEWTEFFGFKNKTLIEQRLKRGWSVEMALTSPIQTKFSPIKKL